MQLHKTLFVVTGNAVFAASAAAAPLLTKSQDSGYTLPHHYQNFTCEISSNRVTIRRTFAGEITTTESRTITLQGDIQAMIDQAAQETLERPDGPTMCDGPSTVISGNATAAAGVTRFVLLADSTCGDDGERKGKASTTLKNIVNALCGSMK